MLTVAVSVASGADAITAALPALHPYNLHIFHFSSLLAYALEFTGLKRICQFTNDSCLSLIISTVFLLLYGIFQLVTGSLSYQATSPIGHAVPKPVHRSHF